MIRFIHRIIILNLLLIGLLRAQSTLVAIDSKKEYLIASPNAYIIFDSLNSYNETNIINAPFEKFSTYGPNSCSKYEIKNYWIKLNLSTSSEGKWFLELLDPHIDEIVFYKLKNNKLIRKSAIVGFNKPFSNKKINYKNNLFEINESEKEPTTYYLNLKTKQVSSFIMKLRPAVSLLEYSIKEYFLLGFYYGLLTLMAIYNLAIYVRVKEKVYLYYVAYVVTCAMNSFSEDGIGFQYIWPNYPEMNTLIMFWIPDILLICFLLYAAEFLNLFKSYKKAMITAWVICITHITCNFINHQNFSGKLDFSIIYLSSFLIIYVLGIIEIRKGNKTAKLFLAGYSFILFSLVIFYLRTLDIIILPHILTIYCFNIGFLMEVVILSYALGERLRLEKHEKQMAQLNTISQLEENVKLKAEYTLQLEKEVKERTFQLENANEEINKINAFLKDKNIKLESDVKVIARERVSTKPMNLSEFKLIYSDESICKEYLFNKKWLNKTYTCGKCGNNKELPHENFTKRCAKCKYVESATANTIFHGVKIPLPEAFFILYLVYNQKATTAEELSKTTNISERSCSVFKKKILDLEKENPSKNKKNTWENLMLLYSKNLE